MEYKLFCNDIAFSKYLLNNEFKPCFVGSEAIVYMNKTDVVKKLIKEPRINDEQIEVQKKLDILDQSTYIGFDSLCTCNDKVIAGIHKFIPGVELIRGIQDVDLDDLAKFIKQIKKDTKIISNNGIAIYDAITFNIVINESGIYFIDTTKFKEENKSDLYKINENKMLGLITEDLFFGYPKEVLLEPISKKLINSYNNLESLDEIIPEIKREYSRYFDSEVTSINDIAVKTSKKLLLI